MCDEPLTNDLLELTDKERAALDLIPADAVDHWLRGEKWDFKKKIWFLTQPTVDRLNEAPQVCTKCGQARHIHKNGLCIQCASTYFK